MLVPNLKVVPSFAESRCTGQECAQSGTSWTSLWYVWLFLLTVFLLLMCGIGASCVKFCCRTKRPPVQAFPPHAHDLTVIPMDHDSTAHSTITSYSSLQYPQSFPLPLPFRPADRSMGSPPAYSLYAIEMPPSYDEAVRMAKPYVGTLFAGQKVGGHALEPAATEEANEPQALPESSHGGPEEVPERPEVLDASTQGQPQP
ncbi:transmembrane protein 52 isoform X2 [Sceloporus undulatus]|uniref:transmembrane protein 52 isoform X2 n=1 Tax=Sceloporus undulatus TaxID=8520 RepID=UPI001C4D7A90|nr:transmembrane protein 52 isoform X2 [Sceloporus undulatus]